MHHYNRLHVLNYLWTLIRLNFQKFLQQNFFRQTTKELKSCSGWVWFQAC